MGRTKMDVKDAVRIAKDYVISLPDKGQIGKVGLEEVRYNPDSGNWEITIGFAPTLGRGRKPPIPL